jgi:hypothetical protein|tara:strand:+ start:745 stop:1206 length:462 start_codon:yes stop_codon:yes gene_type:complete
MIESFFDYDIRIENKMLIYSLVANGKDMTELRMIDFLDRMRQIMASFHDKKVTKVCLYFDVEKLKLPSNLHLIQEYSNIFKIHKEILTQKLEFTIIQTSNNVFHLFFSLFKQYYTPIKPMYLTKNHSETQSCIYDEAKRNHLDTLGNLLDKSS